LTDVSSALYARFQHLRKLQDIEDAITFQEQAVNLCPVGIIYLPDLISALALFRMGRFRRLRRIEGQIGQVVLYQKEALVRLGYPDRAEDLDQAIVLYRSALELCPEDQDRRRFLQDLAEAILERFEDDQMQQDIDDAVQLFRQALDLCPKTHPDRYNDLVQLCGAIEKQSSQKMGAVAIHELVELYREMIVLLPLHHPDRPDRLGAFASILYDRFTQTGLAEYIDQVVELRRQALELRPVDDVNRAFSLSQLSGALHTQFLHQGDLGQIAEVVQLNREVLALSPPGDPNYHGALNNLAATLNTSFEHRGEEEDLDEAVELFRVCLADRSSDSQRAGAINNLGTALIRRYKAHGAPVDIDEAITLLREAADLCAYPHLNHNLTSSNLAASLMTRFEDQGGDDDINEAVQLLRLAVSNASSNSRLDNATPLNNLGSALCQRFETQGAHADLDEAIRRHQEAVDLYPPQDGPGRLSAVSNLANSLQVRHRTRGHREDANASIRLHREALALSPPTHPSGKTSFGNQARLPPKKCFSVTGIMEDIDDAVRMHREALVLRPAGHPDRAVSLNNLATSIHLRFDRLGDAHDLDEIISLHREALELYPLPHPQHGLFLSNLANALRERFVALGKKIDIDESVHIYRKALVIRAPPHPGHRNVLNNLAASIFTRFRSIRMTSDIKEAVRLQQEVLDLCPSEQSERAGFLNNLANCLVEKAQQPGEDALEALNRAIRLHQESLDLRPHPNPARGESLHNLGKSLVAFHIISPLDGYLERATSAFQECSEDTASPTLVRFRSAKEWAEAAARYGHCSVLDAYSVAIGLLPQLAALGIDLGSRQKMLTHAYGLSSEDSDAATCAIASNQYSTAIELLEAGRSIFWSQALNLRTPLDNLRSLHPELAIKFSELSWQLENASFRKFDRKSLAQTAGEILSIEAENIRFRKLDQKWRQTLGSIRALNGFQSFLRTKNMTELGPAALHGPVVILNAGKSSCHALVVNQTGEPQCVLLPELKSEQVHFLAQLLRGLSAGSGQSPNERFTALLGILWDLVAAPKSQEPPRLWWCPTGPFVFLPIHAAGLYDEDGNGESVADYVVSSYTPTLTALLTSASQAESTSDGNPTKLMVVIQPITPGHVPLPYTTEELHRIERTVPKEWLTTLGTPESPASVDKVIAQFSASSIIHFACHGTQDKISPLENSLLIGDGRLKVSRIMETVPASSMGLAVLSACETAMGAQETPDEAMHLAATLLFAGFRSVVATMWSMHDPDGPEIAEDFYGHLFRNADVNVRPCWSPDLTESARALHLAIAKLRRKVPLTRWVPFVHFGL
ncbi:CHAT domain-containing protein, partial [Mycena vitilis]